MHTKGTRGLSASERSSCSASHSPSPKPVPLCGDPKAPVGLLTPRRHAAPLRARDLVSIDVDDFPSQGRRGEVQEWAPPKGAFVRYRDQKPVRCCKGPVRAIPVYTRPPDPPTSVTARPTPDGVGICDIYSCFRRFFKCFGLSLRSVVIIPVPCFLLPSVGVRLALFFR